MCKNLVYIVLKIPTIHIDFNIWKNLHRSGDNIQDSAE